MTFPTTRHVIRSLEEIPAFQTEDEERAFWATHEVSDELAAAAEPIPDGELPPVRERTRSTTIRLEESTIRRLKTIATQRGTRYQTLLKRWLNVWLQQEERQLRQRRRRKVEKAIPPPHNHGLADAITANGKHHTARPTSRVTARDARRSGTRQRPQPRVSSRR